VNVTICAGGEEKVYVMNNYCSFGVDAKIALDFHEMRNANPNLFQSRAINKGWYPVASSLSSFSLSHTCTSRRSCLDLHLSLEEKKV
jgi:diacylglycerol kinase (ATP)